MLARSRTLPKTALIAFALAALITSPSGAADKRSMILATTTSVRDSGLLDTLLPEFTEATKQSRKKKRKQRKSREEGELRGTIYRRDY